MIPGNRAVPLPAGNGAITGTFLVAGIWQVQDQTMHIQPFTTLRCADRNALSTEPAQLCAFVAPQANITSSDGERADNAPSPVSERTRG